jgi:hypothetical protein
LYVARASRTRAVLTPPSPLRRPRQIKRYREKQQAIQFEMLTHRSMSRSLSRQLSTYSALRATGELDDEALATVRTSIMSTARSLPIYMRMRVLEPFVQVTENETLTKSRVMPFNASALDDRDIDTDEEDEDDVSTEVVRVDANGRVVKPPVIDADHMYDLSDVEVHVGDNGGRSAGVASSPPRTPPKTAGAAGSPVLPRSKSAVAERIRGIFADAEDEQEAAAAAAAAAAATAAAAQRAAAARTAATATATATDDSDATDISDSDGSDSDGDDNKIARPTAPPAPPTATSPQRLNAGANGRPIVPVLGLSSLSPLDTADSPLDSSAVLSLQAAGPLSERRRLPRLALSHRTGNNTAAGAGPLPSPRAGLGLPPPPRQHETAAQLAARLSQPQPQVQAQQSPIRVVQVRASASPGTPAEPEDRANETPASPPMSPARAAPAMPSAVPTPPQFIQIVRPTRGPARTPGSITLLGDVGAGAGAGMQAPRPQPRALTQILVSDSTSPSPGPAELSVDRARVEGTPENTTPAGGAQAASLSLDDATDDDGDDVHERRRR